MFGPPVFLLSSAAFGLVALPGGAEVRSCNTPGDRLSVCRAAGVGEADGGSAGLENCKALIILSIEFYRFLSIPIYILSIYYYFYLFCRFGRSLFRLAVLSPIASFWPPCVFCFYCLLLICRRSKHQRCTQSLRYLCEFTGQCTVHTTFINRTQTTAILQVDT